jgi:hypothetical protein
MRCPRGRFPEQPPSTNELCGPLRGFVPGTNKGPRVGVVKNTHLKASCHRVGTTTKHFPHQTQPDVCPRNWPGLPAHPSQSGDQPDHLPLLPRTGVKRSTRRLVIPGVRKEEGMTDTKDNEKSRSFTTECVVTTSIRRKQHRLSCYAHVQALLSLSIRETLDTLVV